jgi:hypothetical protein
MSSAVPYKSTQIIKPHYVVWKMQQTFNVNKLDMPEICIVTPLIILLNIFISSLSGDSLLYSGIRILRSDAYMQKKRLNVYDNHIRLQLQHLV